MMVALLILFMLGIGNFALHQAVLDSDHPLLGEMNAKLNEQMPDLMRLLGGKLSLAVEFLVLLAAMMFAANGWPGLAWVYGGYTALNAAAAWSILTGRM